MRPCSCEPGRNAHGSVDSRSHEGHDAEIEECAADSRMSQSALFVRIAPSSLRSLCRSVVNPLRLDPCRDKIYITGKFVPQEDAKISVFDHGLLYGDGVFEGLRAYGGKVFRLERARRAALRTRPRRSGSTIPMSPDADVRRGQRDRPRQQDRRRLHPRSSSPAAPARSASIPTGAAIRR